MRFDKPCIQIKDVADPLPFDIAGIRTIDVDYTLIKSMRRCKESIMHQIEEIEKDSRNIQSPLGFVASIKSVDKDDAQAKVNFTIVSKLQELNTNIQGTKARVGDNVPLNISRDIFGSTTEDGNLECSHCTWPFLQLGKPIIHYVGDEYDKSIRKKPGEIGLKYHANVNSAMR